MLEPKHVKLLKRLRDGECPRCSKADFAILCKALPGKLQLESVHGAGGKGSLTFLHSQAATNAAIDALFAYKLQT